MNREIKFRVYDKSFKIMNDPFQGELRISQDEIHSLTELLRNKETWEVMQFTGLKDKNGVDIYEGDEMFDGNRHGEIKWIHENARFCLIGSDFAFEMIELNQKNFEVSGNVYQNPDLLK